MDLELSVSFADFERTEYHTTCTYKEMEHILERYRQEFLGTLQSKIPDSMIKLEWYRTSFSSDRPDTQFYLAQAVTRITGKVQTVMRLYYKITQ